MHIESSPVQFLQKMQDEMMDLVDYSSEIQETLGRSYSVPDDLDEEELMGVKLFSFLFCCCFCCL